MRANVAAQYSDLDFLDSLPMSLIGEQRARPHTATVGFLERIGAIQPWTSFAHAIWLDDGEIARLGELGGTIVHNPVSNLKLGAGIAPVPAMRRAGVVVGLGTDGASSNDSQNMFETLKAAALVQRPLHPQSEWPTALDTLRMCWDGGARVLGQPLGRIARGFRADLVLLRPAALRIAPKEQIANQLVYAELGRSVDTVIVDGEVVMKERRVTTVDAPALLADAQRLVDAIWASLPARASRFAELAPTLERLEREVRAFPLTFRRDAG